MYICVENLLLNTGMFYTPDPSPVDPQNQDLGIAVVYLPKSRIGRWQYSKQGSIGTLQGMLLGQVSTV